MVKRVEPTEEEFSEAVGAESLRVHKALSKAFAGEGLVFDGIRFMGLINGTQSFLSGVIANLCDLTEEQHTQLNVDAIRLFAKYAGFTDDQISEPTITRE